MVTLWRDAGSFVQRREEELPMLKPPSAHRVLGLGRTSKDRPGREPRPARPIHTPRGSSEL